MIYDIEFDRIGRNRAVEPITVNVRDSWVAFGRAADLISSGIRVHARKFLASRYFEVVVDLKSGTGSIVAGDRPAGTFTVRERTAGPLTGAVQSSELGDDWTAEHHLRGES